MRSLTRDNISPIVIFAISALGFLGALIAAQGFFLLGIVSMLAGSIQPGDNLSLFSLAWVSLFIAILVSPGLVLSFSRLANLQLTAWNFPVSLRLSNMLMILWPLLVGFGHLISDSNYLSLILLPPLQLLVIGIPITWFVMLGRRKLAQNDPYRDWSLISIGAVIVPVIILAAELAVLVFLGVVFLFWLRGQPALLVEINRISAEILDSQLDPVVLESILARILQNPWALFIPLIIAAGFVPVIEELLKPAAIWFIKRNKLTPSDGFSAGLVCGGIFAFLESLGLFGSIYSDGWATVVLARLGTGLLHVLASGLVGWGIVTALHKRQILFSLLTIFLAIALHSIWNTFGVSLGFLPYMDGNPTGWPGFISFLGRIAPWALLAQIIFMFSLLLLGNRLLRSE